MPMNEQVRRNNSSRSTPERLHLSVSTSGEGEDSEQEYKKYRSTLEQEHIRSRRRFRARVQKSEKIQKYIEAGAHPEQEKIQSKSTRNTEVHWNKSTGEDDSEQE